MRGRKESQTLHGSRPTLKYRIFSSGCLLSMAGGRLSFAMKDSTLIYIIYNSSGQKDVS